MSSDYWEQIQRLYHATLQRRSEERAEFLSQACLNDAELRREVESLLAHEGQADSLLESPAWKHVGAGETSGVVPAALVAGTQLGAFRIVELIGTGGMGEVYRATDTKLHRDVAIKVLPAEYASQPEWLFRFHREARALAALNHPSIAAIYGLEESAGICALAMELVEGTTLAARIARGPIALENGLAIARQIAEALEYAHEKGIVHRDLKPANVKIAPDGAVKVLDFGLAKATQPSIASGKLTAEPTLTATKPGVILGTPAYMPPEQAKGEPVDRRADIWAFGVMLFEMLSGRRLYAQPSVTETLAAVMREEPRWEELPGNTPPVIRGLLRRCLEKDAKRRLRDIGEARIAIEDCVPGRLEPPPLERVAKRQLSRVVFASVVGAVLVVSAVEFARLRFTARPLRLQTVRYQVPVPPGMKFGHAEAFSLSPDGKTLAFLAAGADGVYRIWVQPLDSLEPRMLPGTELAGGDRPPFWSPDSRFLAFYGSHQIKKVDLTGSPPVPICTTEGLPLGGSWSRAGITFGGDTRGIMLVSDKGGEARRLTALDAARGDRIHAFATVLPDGRHFVYSRFSKIAENTGVYVGSLDARPQDQGHKQLVATQHMAVFVPNQGGNGRLLYLRDGVLWAQELDTSRLELSGDPARVAEHVGAYLGLGFFTASAGDIMIYRNGTGHLSQLAWFDRQGKRLGSVGEAMRPESLPVLSPDGKRLAVSLFDGISPSLWMYDLVRNTRQRLTLERGMESAMRWSRDGNRLVFSSNRSGHYDLYQLAASGDGAVDLLYASGNNKFPSGESPDGKFLLYETRDGGSKRAIWILPMDGTGKHAGVPIGRTDANEALAEFSPDGRWIAYVSDSTGTPEVYVREFAPGPAGYLNGPTLQLSNRGGFDPQWTANRKELLYTALDGAVMSVAVSPGPTLQPGPPRVLFSKPKNWVGPASADGQRFLLAVPPEQTAPQPFTVVLNWQAGLHK